jgi:tetratricopeptide (TPR) repeat protein
VSPWSQNDTLGRATTSRIGTALNSDLLVLGSYAAVGKSESRQLRVDARLQDAASGEILEEIGEAGSDQDPFQIVSRIGGRMRQRLGVPALSASDEPGIQAALPSNGEAARLYAQGSMKLREFDAAVAKELFLQTVAVDPAFPLGHSMLAQAWGQLGYDQKSREEAKKALDLSAHLPRAEKMLVEGAYYESLGDPEKAAATYRALLTLFPDSLDDGLRLLNMLDRLGRHEEALETIKQLRRLPPPAGDDPRLDILEYKEVSHTSAPAAAVPLQRAMDNAAARGQKLIYADAKLQACVALQYSEHPEGAIPACQEAYDIFMAAGNRARAASALRNRADATSNEGRKEEALRLYDRAIQMLRESGSRFHLAAAENNKAVLLEQQGHLDQAERLFQEVKRQFEEVGDKTNMNTALVNIADIQVERGDLETGAMTYEEVIANSQHPDREGYPVYRLASLHYMQGRLKEAHHEAEDAIKMISSGGSYFQGSTEAMEVLGEILKAEGDLAGARRQFEEALATRVKLADPGLIAQSRASLASLAIDEDHPPAAEADLRAVLSEFEKEKDVGNQVAANIDLSRALQMQGKIEEARKSILFAREASRLSPDPALTLPVAIQDARVRFATAGAGAARAGTMTAVRDQLRSILTTARQHGYFTFECEARLALGEIEMRIDPRLGRSDLETLAEETHGRGYELLSRKAAALLDPPARADEGPNATRAR